MKYPVLYAAYEENERRRMWRLAGGRGNPHGNWLKSRDGKFVNKRSGGRIRCAITPRTS